MASHVSHIGVHDHGFNNVSTYGNLLRLMKEGKIEQNDWEQEFYELALKVSGAVQATRWTNIKKRRLYSLFQRPPVALCRYHPFLPCTGRLTSAWTHAAK